MTVIQELPRYYSDSANIWIEQNAEKEWLPFIVKWTDGINEWENSFPQLSMAVARMALLIYCESNDFLPMFTHEPDKFADGWMAFCDSETKE